MVQNYKEYEVLRGKGFTKGPSNLHVGSQPHEILIQITFNLEYS